MEARRHQCAVFRPFVVPFLPTAVLRTCMCAGRWARKGSLYEALGLDCRSYARWLIEGKTNETSPRCFPGCSMSPTPQFYERLEAIVTNKPAPER